MERFQESQSASNLKYRAPFLLQTVSGSYVSSNSSSAGSLSNLFHRDAILGVRKNTASETKIQSDVTLPLTDKLIIFSGSNKILSTSNVKPEWIESESESLSESLSEWTIVRSNRNATASSWLPSFLQRTAPQRNYATDTGSLCYGEAIHLVSSSSLSTISSTVSKQYLTLTGQYTTRKKRAGTYYIRPVTFQQLNSLSATATSTDSTHPQTKESKTSTTWTSPTNFPLHLLHFITRTYLPNGLHLTRLINHELERNVQIPKIAASNDFDSIDILHLLDFVKRKCVYITAIKLRNFHGGSILQDDTMAIALSQLTSKSSLTHVDFCGCPGIGDSTLSVLCKLNATLRTLKLGCTKITDDGLELLLNSKATIHLEHLNLYGCNTLTETGMKQYLLQLIKTRLKMRDINIRGTAVRGIGWTQVNGFYNANVRILTGGAKEDSPFFCN